MNSRTRNNIIEACTILAEQENLKVTVTESGKGALLTGLGVFVGGLLAGPPGMAVGGTLTSLGVAWRSMGTFKPVADIINEMTPDQKERLSEAINQAIKNTKPEDFMGVLTVAFTSASIKDVIIAELGAFLMKELQVKMVC